MIYALINKFYYGSYGDSDFKRTLDIFKEFYQRRDFRKENFLL